MNFSKTLQFVLLPLIALLVLSGCTRNSDESKQEVIYEGVFTVSIIEEKDITIDPEFEDVYPYVFSEMYVILDDRDLLTVENDVITTEAGNSIGAGIETKAAYAGNVVDDPEFGEPIVQVIQIDDEGLPVSEPFEVQWSGEQWVVINNNVNPEF